MLAQAIQALQGDVRCVVANGGRLLHCASGSGLKPLWTICHEHAADLVGASVADRVIGRAAAALLIDSGASAVYGAVMSQPAYDWLTAHGIAASYGTLVPFIENRDGTAMCPMEQLVADALTPQEAVARLTTRLQ